MTSWKFQFHIISNKVKQRDTHVNTSSNIGYVSGKCSSLDRSLNEVVNVRIRFLCITSTLNLKNDNLYELNKTLFANEHNIEKDFATIAGTNLIHLFYNLV